MFYWKYIIYEKYPDLYTYFLILKNFKNFALISPLIDRVNDFYMDTQILGDTKRMP